MDKSILGSWLILGLLIVCLQPMFNELLCEGQNGAPKNAGNWCRFGRFVLTSAVQISID